MTHSLYNVGRTGCAVAWADALVNAGAVDRLNFAPARDVLSDVICGFRDSVARDVLNNATVNSLVLDKLYRGMSTSGAASLVAEEPELPLDQTGVLLAERGKTHGDWHTQATITNSIKQVFLASPNWHGLSPVVKEGLDMVATKLGRILCGDPGERDHFDDAIGYLRLARDRGHK